MTASSGQANGQTSSDIGIDEETALVGHSLQLIGTGNNYAAFTWTGSMNSTHDQVNTNQSFCVPTSNNNCTGDSSQVKLVLTTAIFGSEISWSITDGSGAQADSGSGYSSNTTYSDTLCIANCESYNFNMYDSYGDGWNGGSYALLVLPGMDTISSGELTDPPGTYGFNVFQYCTSVGIPKIEFTERMWIYPNPFTESTTIEFDNSGEQNFLLKIYNSMGQMVRDLHAVHSNRITIYKNELKAGLYIIELSNETKQFRNRVIIK